MKSLTGKVNMAMVLIGLGAIVAPTFDASAAVTQRGGTGSAARVSVGRAPISTTRMPTATVDLATSETTQSAAAPDTKLEDLADVIIEDKTSQFDDVFEETNTSVSDSSSDDLAEKIRRQRAALDAADAITAATSAASGDGANLCNQTLRDCMKEKCGKDYTGCAKDGDTMWGDKMDACRAKTKCTANEYSVLSVEIKADRDMNVKLASYNAIIDCGKNYNSCIEQQCGTTFTKCLSKTASDTAIAACDKVAKQCVQQDSGLAGRSMEVIATLRQDAEKQVQADEKHLYELRDKMRSQCTVLGAAFDERSFDCVFTVNFYANNSSTPYATRRAYAGSSFNCTQDWFGVDVTTFKENAARLTRQQTSESMGELGDGLGAAVGMATSGVLSRAIDRKKADDALKKAKDEKTVEDAEADAKNKNSKALKCKADEEEQDGKCVPKSTTLKCDEGQEEQNGKCVPKSAAPGDDTQPPGAAPDSTPASPNPEDGNGDTKDDTIDLTQK